MNKQILRNIIFVGLFAVPFVPFLVSGSLFFPFITTKAFAWRFIVEIIFAVWLILALFDVEVRPKKSKILYSVLAFLVVVGLADVFGVSRETSIWSNYERMEGYVSMLHLGAFFLVIGSMFKETDWKKWWNVSLLASFLMVLYSLLQILGLKTINQGGVRVDGTLGNAIYLAVYMLFHIFVAFLMMWREWRNTVLRWVYGILILSQTFILYHTATRGAILGLLGGIFIIALLNLRNKEDAVMRKGSIAIIAGLVILIGGFFIFRNSAFVQGSPVLSRFASLGTQSTQGLKNQGRYYTWPMAWKGMLDRPLLGWGQENFNNVFQKYYDPGMFRLEPWFDRAHNVFLDWGVASGFLGLITYLGLYISLLIGIWRSSFSYSEKTIIVGLLAAYFFHNIFVFDHLVSYILFFSLLSYIYSVSHREVFWANLSLSTSVKNLSAVLVGVALIFTLYFVNWKPLSANLYLIDALQALQTPGSMSSALQYFKKAYGASSLSKQETVEHISSNSTTIFSSSIPVEERNEFFSFAKGAILNQADKRSNDARTQLVAGSFLSLVGQYDEALKYLDRAQVLMPGKQQIAFERGSVYIGKKEPAQALAIFKEAYENAPDYDEAGLIYLIGAIYAKDFATEKQLLEKLDQKQVAFDDRIANAYYNNGRIEMLKVLISVRMQIDPEHKSDYQKIIDSLPK